MEPEPEDEWVPPEITPERMAEQLEESGLHHSRDSKGRFVFTLEELDNLLMACGCSVY